MNWIILALLSAFFVAIADILAKHLFNKKIQPVELLFSQAFFVIVLVLLLFFKKIDFTLSWVSYALFILKVCLLQGANLLFLGLLRKHDTSKIIPLTNLSPIILIILSTLFLGESASLINLLGILIIMFATYYLEVLSEHHHEKHPTKKHASFFKSFDKDFALRVVGFLFLISCTAVLDKFLLQTITPYTNIFFTYILTFIFAGIYLIHIGALKSSIQFVAKTPLVVVSGAALFFSILCVLSAMALPDSFVSLVIPVKRTSTFMAAFLAGLLFHEAHMKRKLYSIGLMLLGVLLVAL